MEYQPLGKTGLRVSALGFGSGNVGGLMIPAPSGALYRFAESSVPLRYRLVQLG